MTTGVDLKEFVGGFVAESEELIGAATAALLEIETALGQGTTRPKAVRDLFRALHTLKGLAGMIGVEPIVELAHELETLVRTADQAGGRLGRAAVEVTVEAVREIADRVRAVAAGRTVEPAPERLLAVLAITDSAADTPAAPAPRIPPAWESRLGTAEKAQLANAIEAATPIWALTFVPDEALAGRGITIAVVRGNLASAGDLIKVVPRATPGGVAFDLLFASHATAEAIAEAAGAPLAKVELVENPAPAPAPAAAPVVGSPGTELEFAL